MKIAFLTAGGLAPCLSASIAALVNEYEKLNLNCQYLGYLNGYQGLLKGKSYQFPDHSLNQIDKLFHFGGSVIGNSRIKLTNHNDCVEKGLISKNDNPIEIAANQLMTDGIDILHTIGGDDTNTMAAELSKFIEKQAQSLTVIGLPKTVDNDIIPIKKSLGADSAAQQTANYFENIVNENTASTRHLIIHEVMGRHCGWLTAESAIKYRNKLLDHLFSDELLLKKSHWDIDAVFIPEMNININEEGKRLLTTMDEKGCVNIFLSEGACINEIILDMKKQNKKIKRDAFGHVRLDEINPGQWFAKQFSKLIGAEKTLVQKSGYFARSSSPNEYDLRLIKDSAIFAVRSAMESKTGVVGLDEENEDKMSLINFNRIKGGKAFNPQNETFIHLLNEIGQSP